MKIDIHVHTKKVKAGDAESRNINLKRFTEIIKATDVKILAITNHNHFDLAQFQNFKKAVAETCQVWPGIELDILEDGKRGHLIVLANPVQSKDFDLQTKSLINGIHPDKFTTDLSEIVRTFEKIDCIYIAHYHSKKPNLEKSHIEILSKSISNPRRILKEATNSVSAGIYISHGHNSIYGSDVHNWDDYLEISKSLPELRLPVESFEQFCLLLEKDDVTINTLLDKKSKEIIQVSPFGIAESFELEIFNDINIIFGSKGTGKTEILKALSKYYNSKGYKSEVYQSSTKHVNVVYDLKCSNFKLDLNDLGLEDCQDEFTFLRNAVDREVTSLNKYFLHYSIDETNKIAKKIAIKDFERLDESEAKRNYKEINTLVSSFKTFQNFIFSNPKSEIIIGASLLKELNKILDKIFLKLNSTAEERVFHFRTIKMFNSLIKIFVSEIAKKTGQPEKPLKTGFSDYSINRLQIHKAAEKIIKNLSLSLSPKLTYVGNLGEKGDLYCQTTLSLQNGNHSVTSSAPIKKVTKSAQKEVAKKVQLIEKHILSDQLFEKINHLNEVEGGEAINSISDLLLIHRHFSLNGNLYNPSNGESSMILLHNELVHDKEIYLLDEPEKSLGNDYISDVIVPLLKEKASLGKKIIIATHDANIAVRTLPYNSIYRLHDLNRYYTYSGNPFSNSLKCITKDRDDLDWKEISMKTLEGGKSAFGERGKIYGNI